MQLSGQARRPAVIVLATVVTLAGTAVLALTPHGPWVGGAVVLLGVLLARKGGARGSLLARLGLLALSGAAFGLWNFSDLEVSDMRPPLEAGQYTARSGDLLGLVEARAVLREGGILIFAEAHAPPLLGLDPATLVSEARRVLRLQSVPSAPAPQSDPVTGRLVLTALAAALSGATPRQDPVMPEGSWTDEDRNSYWGMFPNEFDHRCELESLSDGEYAGTSSNPSFPARVSIEVRDGRLRAVRIDAFRRSEHGARAATELPRRMVARNRVDVDVVSGATRSSWILRSAVYHACRAAGSAP